MSDAHRPNLTAAGNLRLEPAAELHRWSVRARPDDRAFLEQLLQLQLPVQPLRSSGGKAGSALWLGPDEWLVLLNPAAAGEFRDRCARFDWGAAPPASVVDVTHRSVAIRLSGTGAPWVINSGCPLDLAPHAFTPGSCTRTLFAKAEIVLWHVADTEPCYYLECWRSFAPYVWTRLRQAAAECVAEQRRAGPRGGAAATQAAAGIQ
jgi:sarcosine oxidase subunit gamma